MTPDLAESIAIRALGHIAASDELCDVFLGSTGASLAEMRARIQDREFLASVLEFLTMDDAWVLEFCNREGLDPTDPLTARNVLNGPAGMHWT